jgi:hypothetical protein
MIAAIPTTAARMSPFTFSLRMLETSWGDDDEPWCDFPEIVLMSLSVESETNGTVNARPNWRSGGVFCRDIGPPPKRG